MTDNFDIWQKSKTESFLYINERSNVKDAWLSYSQVPLGKFKDSAIKPINGYVENLYPFPKLINISDNVVRLRQHTHAQIFLKNGKGGLTHVDRPWIRQYYNTNNYIVGDDKFFPNVFRFYVPWFIDDNIKVKIEEPDEECPFMIYETEIDYFKKTNLKKIDPPFVNFRFKKTGAHMRDDEFGKIDRGAPMFDMVFACSGIMIKSIEEFYERQY